MTLDACAALETAAVNLMRASLLSGGLAYDPLFCGRRFDDKPPPFARGRWYAAVWSDDAVEIGRAGANNTALDESFAINVTVTVELVEPADRWVVHRDALRQRRNEIRVLIGKDVYDNRVINAANVLASLRRGDPASGATQSVGLYRGLAFLGADAVVTAGPEWIGGEPDSNRCFLYQRLRFGGAMRLQDWADAE